jgi:hypothetical protein
MAMEVLQEQQENGKGSARTFVVAGDGTVTVMNGARRGFYLAHATADCFVCVRASNRANAEREIEGWLNSLSGECDDILIRVIPNDADVARVSRAAAAELLGASVALLEPPELKRCECGAPRDRGRRLCGTCRLERVRERDARRRTKTEPTTVPFPGQLERVEVDVAGNGAVGVASKGTAVGPRA